MSRPNPARLLGLFLVVIAALGGAALAKGGLYIGKHEGDTYHLIEIVERMLAGQMPHRDFMTPIGAMAFAPIVAFARAGMGIGMAILWAQVLVALCLLPAVWWVAQSRLSPLLAALWGLIVMVLVLALTYGEPQASLTISMHYNRWAWAIAFVAITAAILPPVHAKRPVADGVIVGLMMAGLAMIKVTYLVAFTGPVVLGLILTGQRKTLGVAVLTGLVVLAGLTVWLSPDYWRAYIGDLLAVSRSTVRPAPGQSLGEIYGGPAYLGGTIAALMGVILLRQAKVAAGGVVLLTLIPGFVYVTYQNFGNDPQWLLLLGVLLLALRPDQDLPNGWGWPLRTGLTVTGAVALALTAPGFFNMAYSPFRHLSVDTALYSPMLPAQVANADIQTVTARADRVDVRMGRDDPGEPFAAYHDRAKRDDPATFKGETFKTCSTELGTTAFFEAMTQDLEAAGYGDGQKIFTADLLNAVWLFGDFQPLTGGAPWYYGGLPGWDDADFLLAPACPIAPDVQAKIFKALTDAGQTDALTEVRRTPMYVLYAKP